MPYELEYKKVHNTLSKQKNINKYGYEKGDRITYIDWSENIPLNSWDQYIMVQNLSNNNLSLSISFREEDNSGISNPVVIVGSGYYSAPTDILHIFVKCQIPANESFLIKLPAAKEHYNSEIGRLVTPVAVKLQVPSGFDSNDLKVWYTQENIWTYEENDFIVNYIDTPWTTYLEWNESPLLNDIKESLAHSTFEIILDTEADPNVYNCSIHLDSDYYQFSNTDLNNLNIDIVLVPCKYYSINSIKQDKREQAQILKSITNTRNSRQNSVYTGYVPMSAYAEPIIFDWSSPGSSVRSLALPSATPITSDMNATITHRNNTAYALIDSNPSKILTLCQGCGYDNGANEGYTYIKFGIGIQTRKSSGRHSGCGLDYFNIPAQDPIALSRRALASTNISDNPVILIEE